MNRSTSSTARGRDLGARLLLAIVVVVLVGAATAWVVVAGVGPAIFHAHMIRVGTVSPDVTAHAEEAFRTASALSLTLALAAASLTSVVVSVFLTRRITRSLKPVIAAARRVALRDYTVRVPPMGMGSEFDELSDAFNGMSADLGRVEQTRTKMLGDLAHEMRTPIATLGAYLEAITDGVEHADTATLDMLRDQVGRLTRLSEDIALVTTADEGRLSMRRRPLAVAKVVVDVTAQTTSRCSDRGIALAVQVSPIAASAIVEADGDRIAQVITNLLDNAVRHTPRGGHVTVTVDQVGARVRITVADDGQGIPSEHLPHVFDRFYRVDSARDRAHGGSGVGLSIARAITEAHNGTITVHSDGPGRGAVFTVMLPLGPTTNA